MTETDPDTPGTDLPANAEKTEPTDLAPEPSSDVPVEAEGGAEPAAESASEPEAAPAATLEPDATPEPEATPEPVAEAEPIAEAGPDATPEPEAAVGATDAPAEELARPDPGRGPAVVQQPAPGAGPVIIGTAPEPPPLPARRERLADDKPARPKRRRVNATQRHRNVFFARLNEFRRNQAAGIEAPEELDAEASAAAAAAADAAEGPATEEAPAAETPATDEAPAAETPATEEAPAAEAPATEEAPAAEAPATDEAPAAEAPAAEAPATEEAPAAEAPDSPDQRNDRRERRASPPPPIDRPRLAAAIQRAGGEDVLREALAPKRDENGQPLKWATVCADACKGLKPGDPVFGAWVRLAATPVSAIKNEIGMEREERGGRGRGGPRRGGGGGGCGG